MGTVFIAKETFGTMLAELMDADGARYDTMVQIVLRCAEPTVRNICKKFKYIGEEDIKDICQKTVNLTQAKVFSSFMYYKDKIADVDDVGRFVRWVQGFAKNVTLSYLNEEAADRCFEDVVDPHDLATLIEGRTSTDSYIVDGSDRLEAAVAHLWGAKSEIHITFSWLLQMITILDQNCPHHEALGEVVRLHRNRTMTQVYEFIVCATERIPWFRITEEQNAFVQIKLSEPTDDGVRCGDVRYEVYLCNRRGDFDGHNKLSKWWSRLSGAMCEALGTDNEKKAKKDKKATNKKATDGKGAERNEASDNG